MSGRVPPSVRLAIAACGAALALPGAAAAACPAGATDGAAVVCEVNAARAGAGLAPLRFRPSLAAAARAHADDMVARRFFAHADPDGDGPAQRARRAGYLDDARSWRLGEVLAWWRGEPLTAAAVVRMWLDSTKHRGVLLSPRYRDIGPGIAPGAPAGDPRLAPATTMTVLLGRRSRWRAAAG